ncbi:MAG: cytochrome c biogenesis protein CcsA [Coriobacteriales bacterium]|jgi:ABC-type uncharacterized transport system permease subunit|nr:cytochrome c biogenesis protein CcsA [Coriobacteriales bacterium]
MDFITNITFALTVACSCCAAALYIYQYIRHDAAPNLPRRFFLLLSVAGLALLSGLLWNSSGSILYSAPNIFLLVASALGLVYAAFELLSGKSAYGAFVLPLVVIALVIGWFATVMPGDSQVQALQVYQQWPPLVVHVGAFIAAAVCFLIGGVASILLLRQVSRLKRNKQRALAAKGSSLAGLQGVAKRAVLIGLPILTVGLLLGISEGFVTGQISFSDSTALFSARVVASCLLWCCYVLYLAMAYILESSWRSLAWLSIIGSLLTLAIMALSATMPMLGN